MFYNFLQYEFIQRALIAGTFVSLLCSVLGIFVVQRKMSFLGSGLSHSALGGIGMGILLGIDPMTAAIPFTILAALLIILLKNRTNLEIDTSIGILFSASVAAGIILISIKAGYTSDAYSYLFGSILAISSSDVVASLILTSGILLVILLIWKELAYSTFDRELAVSDGINVIRQDYILACLLAIAIVISIKLVGIVLISAFLVLPPATARIFSRTFSQMLVLSVCYAITTCVTGLFLSFILDLPSGATIILFQTFIFTICLIFKRITT